MRSVFQSAIQDCNIRSLRLGSKWLSELLLGLIYEDDDEQQMVLSNHGLKSKEWDLVTFINSILQSGEYQRATQYMRNYLSSPQHKQTSNPIPYFLYVYSMYMSGEKLKEQLVAEDEYSSNSEANNGPSGSKKKLQKVIHKNPCLSELMNELHPKYMEAFNHQNHNSSLNTVDSMYTSISPNVKMDSFLLYLYGVVLRDIRKVGDGGNRRSVEFTSLSTMDSSNANIISPAYYVLLQACVIYPYNWSCWLELAKICLTDKVELPFHENSLLELVQVIRDDFFVLNRNINSKVVDIIRQYLTADNVEGFQIMAINFLVHIYLEQQNGELALCLLQKYLLPIFPQSQIIQSNIAMSHYIIRDYNMAQQCYEVSREKDPYRMDSIDTYSNILYVKECRSELSYLAHSVTKVS